MNQANYNLDEEHIQVYKNNPQLRSKVIQWLLCTRKIMPDTTKVSFLAFWSHHLTLDQVIMELCRDMPFYKEIVNTLLGEKSEQKVIEKFFDGAEFEKLKRNQVLFQQGEPSNNKCYIILSGRVLVIRDNIDGNTS